MKLKKFMLLLLLMGAALAFSEKRELDVNAAIDLASQNNTGLKMKQLDTEFQRLTRDSALNVLLPAVSVNSTLFRLHDAPSSFAFTGGAPTMVPGANWGLQFGLSANLNLSAALVHGLLYTRKQYEAGLLDEATFKKNLTRDVKKSFYSLLFLEQNITLFRESLQTAEQRFTQARLNFESGTSSQFDLLTTQVAYENLKPALKELENGYQIALLNFKTILGLKNDEELALKGEIQIEPLRLDSEQLLTQYLPQKPELQALNTAIESAEIARQGFFIQNYTPAVLLSFSMDPAFTGNPFSDNLFGNPENNWVQRQGMFGVTVALNLDGFIPGSTTSVRLAELKKTREKLELQRSQALQGAELEIRTLTTNMEKSQANLMSLDLNVQLAARAYQIASEGFATGARTWLEVQNAEDELNRSKLEVLREKYNYLANMLDLEAALHLSAEQVKELQNEK